MDLPVRSGRSAPPLVMACLPKDWGGGIAGEGFFRMASTFCFEGAVFFNLQIQRINNGQSGKTVSKEEKCLVDLLLAGNVKPSKGVIVLGRLGANRK